MHDSIIQPLSTLSTNPAVVGGAHQEYRVIGPPGTGKTTWLAKQAIRAVSAHCERTGERPAECQAVLISTLTRGAATELRSRGITLHPDQIGTLHAHAYRALGRPKLCVEAKQLAEWNEQCRPSHRLPSGSMSRQSFDSAAEALDESIRGGAGPRLLQEYFTNRSRLRGHLRSELRAFADEWEAWKRVNGYMDFSDVIHEAYERQTEPPGAPSVIFVDEAQDHDRAELRLIRWWASRCEKVIVVGDPDQNLYEFRGSEPEAFYDHEIPAENTRVLSQSYRVPVAVHRRAVQMIERCKSRRPVEYRPRDFQGEVRETDYSLRARTIDCLCREVERVGRLGKSVMVLSSCEYHLRPLASHMREQGVPFWNPFDQNRNTFSPLHPKAGLGILERMKAFLRVQDEFYGEDSRMWTGSELAIWSEPLRSEGWLKRGAKQEIDRLALQYRDRMLPLECLEELLVDEFGVEQLAECGIEWYVGKTAAAKSQLARYCYAIYKRYGAAGVMDDPKVILGTIHSVKGGEADVVFLSPDLSMAGLESMELNPDSIYRLMYVGMTRARESLYLMQPSRGDMAIEW